MSGYVTPRTFRFLRALAQHNDRAWFEAHKETYVADVRDPLLRLVQAFAPKLAKLSRHLVADPRPVGGSLFRIYRDTRFSRDKTPYKTHAGLSFRHERGRDVHAPLFYLHVEPGRVFAAAGMWRPPAEAVRHVRDAIAARPEQWRRVTRACPLGLEDDSLRRPPRGYDPDHPLIEDLKRQSFITRTGFTEAAACAPGFLDRFAESCRGATPLMEFLTKAVNLPW